MDSFFSKPFQNNIQSADDHLEHIDLFMQQIQDVFFNGACRRQIVDIDIILLSQPMYPANSLLYPHAGFRAGRN